MAGKKNYPDVSGGGNSATVAGAQLRAFMERIERMQEEKAAVTADIREIFAEAKGNGFDVKIMRIILKRRAMDKSERDEQDALVDTYSAALGMLPADSDDDQ